MMRVIGAFIDTVVGVLVAEWVDGLAGIEFGGAGCDTNEVLADAMVRSLAPGS